MYTQIVSGVGPQAKVLAHLLRLSGAYFNDIDDATNTTTFTYNTVFEDYYRAYTHGANTANLPPEVQRELLAFLRHTDLSNTASVNKEDWRVFETVASSIHGRLLFVEYTETELNAEFPTPTDSQEYVDAQARANKMKIAAEVNGWNVVTCNYAEFLTSNKYQKNLFAALGLQLPAHVETVVQLYHDEYASALAQNKLQDFVNENTDNGTP
ncbi:MAG: hypothetical protein EBU08_04060 [Micrococcales bacterium]|nr:hypothetical protein [Micrococcales bacterium]